MKSFQFNEAYVTGWRSKEELRRKKRKHSPKNLNTLICFDYLPNLGKLQFSALVFECLPSLAINLHRNGADRNLDWKPAGAEPKKGAELIVSRKQVWSRA